MTSFDLNKTLVSRYGLWKILANNGCPPRLIAMRTRVQKDGGYSVSFPVTNGVKQGCVMAPTLVSMTFLSCSQMLL